MITRHRTNKPMHRVRMYVDTGQLEENIYELYTQQTDVWRLWGVPIWAWTREVDVQRRPIHELIDQCIKGVTPWPDQEVYEAYDPDVQDWAARNGRYRR